MSSLTAPRYQLTVINKYMGKHMPRLHHEAAPITLVHSTLNRYMSAARCGPDRAIRPICRVYARMGPRAEPLPRDAGRHRLEPLLEPPNGRISVEIPPFMKTL